jgi:hypothetical protein
MAINRRKRTDAFHGSAFSVPMYLPAMGGPSNSICKQADPSDCHGMNFDAEMCRKGTGRLNAEGRVNHTHQSYECPEDRKAVMSR